MPVVIVFCGWCTAVNPAFAQTWTQTGAPNWFFQSIASSADGSKLVAVGNGWVYASMNSGATWMQITNPTGPADTLLFVALSADGTKIAATSLGGSIYTSTNLGVTWMSNGVPSLNLMAIVSSADGDKLVVAAGEKPAFGIFPITNGPIYVSTNSGAAWTVTGAPTNYWSCVASSADGTRLAAGTIGVNSQGYLELGGLIYVSTDSGTTWMRTSAPTNAWASIASSADGTKLAAASPISIYTSADSGASWFSNNVPATAWQAITMSADGTKLAALDQNYHVYTSPNFGASWASNSVPQPGWDMASSADGNELVMISINGGIWLSQTTPSPLLKIAPTNGNVSLSWLVPSTNFVLQQNLDLTTTNWVTLKNAPTLNLTNLRDEATLSPTNSSGFFRLVSQ